MSVDADLAELLSQPVQFRDRVFRNIKSLRHSEDLFDDLTDDPQGFELAHQVEAATRAPVDQPAVQRPFDDVIGFPFTHFSNTRFSDGTFGVFYGSLSLDTTIYETVYHWWQFLKDSGFDDVSVVGERRVHLVNVDGLLFDCQEGYRDYPGLVDPVSYEFTHRVGRYLHQRGRDGLLTRSARCEGVNTPVFSKQRLTNPTIHCYLTYKLDPRRGRVRVEKQHGRSYLNVELSSFTYQ